MNAPPSQPTASHAAANPAGPTQPVTADGEQSSTNWQVWVGLIATFSYLALIAVYVDRVIGWDQAVFQPLDMVGSFLEGAFAPLAFLWLVIGYFLQKKELSSNTAALMRQNEAIRLSAEHAMIQSRSSVASVQHARTDSFLRIAESVKQQLGVIMGFLYISSQLASGAARQVDPEKISELWNSISQRDPEIFARQMLTLQLRHGERYSYKLCFGTPVRTRHTLNFIFNFERMLRAAEQCDSDGMISDALLGSANGYFYRRALALRDHPPQGFHFEVYDFDPDTLD